MLCGGPILVGERYCRRTYIGDDGYCDFIECPACDKDNVLSLVLDWSSYPDEGVDFEDANDWAVEARRWQSSFEPAEVSAANRYLDRVYAAGQAEAKERLYGRDRRH
jgi:hypothetical protein